MGAFNSIHEKLKDFSDADEHNPDYSTPQKPLKHKCLVGIDPRSPTENIDRTPIIVDGTPNVVCPSSRVLKATTFQPSQSEGPIDPRSPSVDFTRTPLSFEQPTTVSSDTPIKAPTSMKNENVELSGNKPCSLSIESVSSSDKIFMTEESSEDSFDTAPLLESTEKLSISSNQTNKKTGSFGDNVETDDSISSQTKLKCRQVNRILSQHTSSPVKPRSPLTLVDNSSRVSQSSKKAITTPSGKTHRYNNISTDNVIDKENVCH